MQDKRFKFENACQIAGINNLWTYIFDLYKNGMSGNEISEHFLNKFCVSVSPKYLTEKIKIEGILRNYKERKLNAIKKGRMIYYKKPESEKQKRGYLDKKIRIIILQSKKFTCEYCGNSPKTGASIEIHHKDFNPLNNKLDNLEVLCFSCHKGIHAINNNKI